MVDLRAGRRSGTGGPARCTGGPRQPGRVTQSRVGQAAEGGVVLGGVEVAREEGGRMGGVLRGEVAQGAQLLPPEADLAGDRRHRMGELDPYGVTAGQFGDRTGHAHRAARNALRTLQRKAAEDDRTVGTGPRDGLPGRPSVP